MSLTPDAASTLRRALATAVVVPVTPYQADGNPDWDTYAALAAFWAVGARGFTSGVANVSPGIAVAMLDALRANDPGAAMKVWESVRRFEELRLADASADNVSVVKEAMAQLGLCRADVRPPSRPLPEEIKAEIDGILTSWGMK